MIKKHCDRCDSTDHVESSFTCDINMQPMEWNGVTIAIQFQKRARGYAVTEDGESQDLCTKCRHEILTAMLERLPRGV